MKTLLCSLLLCCAALAQYPFPTTPPIYLNYAIPNHANDPSFCARYQAGSANADAQDVSMFHRWSGGDRVCLSCVTGQDNCSVATSTDKMGVSATEYPVVFILRITPNYYPTSTTCGYGYIPFTVPGAASLFDDSFYDPSYPDYVVLLPESISMERGG